MHHKSRAARAIPSLRPLALAACLAGLLAAPGAYAASHTGKAVGSTPGAPARPAEMDNSGNYRQEVQACRAGRTGEDLATCMTEARNAEAERRKGTLTNNGSLEQNALARCEVFKTSEDKEACRARIVGHVEIEGSVAGGGILRQVSITQPAPPPVDNENAMGAGARPAQPGVVPPTNAPSNDLAPEGDEEPEALPEDDPDAGAEEMLEEAE